MADAEAPVEAPPAEETPAEEEAAPAPAAAPAPSEPKAAEAPKSEAPPASPAKQVAQPSTPSFGITVQELRNLFEERDTNPGGLTQLGGV